MLKRLVEHNFDNVNLLYHKQVMVCRESIDCLFVMLPYRFGAVEAHWFFLSCICRLLGGGALIQPEELAALP